MKVLRERRGRVLCLTIHRPEAMNALDSEAVAELARAWEEFRDDPDLWVAIITGSGERAFCAGADLMTLIPKAMASSGAVRRSANPSDFGLWKPVIAAINGYCLAGGLGLALACDLRLAADHARFATMGAKRGIIPGAGQTQRLPRLMPLAKALEMIFLGDFIDAQEAYRLGLVNKVVPLPQLMPTAWEWAEALCQNAPLAIRGAKEAALRGLDLPLEEGLRLEDRLASQVLKSRDAKEGVRAFAEKRKAVFKGQ